MSPALHSYERDELVDLIRELRVILGNEDLLDADIEADIKAGLNILGVADEDEN